MFHQIAGKFIYEVDHDIQLLSWRVLHELHSSEVMKIVDTIKETIIQMPQQKVKLLADNRYITDNQGYSVVFPNRINHSWIQLQQWLIPHCSRVAVLCGTLVMDAQMKRLAGKSGLDNVLRSFYDSDPNKCMRRAYAYLGITENRLVESLPDNNFKF